MRHPFLFVSSDSAVNLSAQRLPKREPRVGSSHCPGFLEGTKRSMRLPPARRSLGSLRRRPFLFFLDVLPPPPSNLGPLFVEKDTSSFGNSLRLLPVSDRMDTEDMALSYFLFLSIQLRRRSASGLF